MSARQHRGYAAVRAETLDALAAAPALTWLRTGDEDDWIVALAGAWAALAEVIGFYQERIAAEAFLPTAEQVESVQRIYHSLGHAFPPNVAATTTLAYHLSATVAGVEAVGRARSAGGTGATPQERARQAAGSAPAGGGSATTTGAGPGTGTGGWPGPGAAGPGTDGLPTATGLPTVGVPAGIATDGPGPAPASAVGVASTVPAAAQVRAIPGPSGAPPTFVTLAPLGAYVGASRLLAAATTTVAPPAIGAGTTLLELAGARTGLAVGQPILIEANVAGGGSARWVRVLTEVTADGKRGATRVTWGPALGTLEGEPSAEGATDPIVYGFAKSSRLVGAGAPAWSTLGTAQQLATPAGDGTPVAVRGGFASATDGGTTWTPSSAGLPVDVDLTAVTGFDGVTIVSAGASGLFFRTPDTPFAAATLGGGARRAVGFLGGDPTTWLLAGAANGTVYTSVDQGRTWSPVPVRAPKIEQGKAAEDAATASGGTQNDATTTKDGTTVVTSYQLPAAAVRAVLADPAAPAGAPLTVLAGTDSGLFAYADGGWAPVTGTGAPPAGVPVFALVLDPDGSTVLAATGVGVYARAGTTWSQLASQPAQALAVWGGLRYVAAGDTVYALEQAPPPAAVTPPPAAAAPPPTSTATAAGAALPGGRVTALLAGPNGLLAGTAAGVYLADGSGTDLTWTRCDHAPAFTFPTALLAVSDLEGKTPPDALVAAFAIEGIVLGPDAQLTGASPEWTVTDGDHAYGLARGSTVWTVTLLDALPGVADLALGPHGVVLAAAAAAESAATEWPGFVIAGAEVELSPPLTGVAPGTPAVIEQRTPSPDAQVLDLASVEQDTAVRAGRPTPLTRLGFAPTTLAPGRFPRRSTSVWTGATALPLFDPPPSTVTEVAGKTLTLERDLPAPLEPGRLATITGRPPGLTVAPLGGVLHVPTPGPTADTVSAGPPQADVVDLALADDGTVYLATDEGVLTIAPPPAPSTTMAPAPLPAPVPARLGWPGGSASAVALLRNGMALAGSEHGVLRLVPSPAGPTWHDAGLAGTIAALCCDGTRAVAARADGSLHRTVDATKAQVAWTTLPPLGGKPTAIALTATGVVAATAAGVLRLDDGAETWSVLEGGTVPGPVTALAVDPDDTLWAGSPAGLHSLAAAGGTWQRDAQISDGVSAIATTTLNAVVVAAGDAVFMRAAGTSSWAAATPATGALVGALAGGADGALWLGARAVLPLAVAPGAGAPMLRHARLFTGIAAGSAGLRALAQGAVPASVIAAFADAGHPLDPTHAVVVADGPGCWTVRSGTDLFVLASRDGGGAATLNAYRVQAVLSPVGLPTGHGTVRTWPVQVGGLAAELSAPAARLVRLPAGADAPALAETAHIATAATATLGAGSRVELTAPLTHIYDASTVQVNLNAVAAAHGQPTSLPIGSGDPDQSHQSFPVPTPVAAIAPASADPAAVAHATSLRVYVDGQPWTEVPSLHPCGPQDAVYVTQHDADGRARVTFGDGTHGARLPAGHDNVVATYLQGGGDDGEVAQGTLIQPLLRPQLVRAVHNPMAALVPPLPSATEARVAAVRRLDRIVTLQDYEDVARAQAGVRSAAVDLVVGGLGRALVVSVVAAAAAPDDLLDHVRAALGSTTASGLPVRVVAARPVSVSASVHIVAADDAAVAKVQDALGGLAADRPGLPLRAAQLLSVATAVPGVVAATVDGWSRVGEPTVTTTALPAARASWPATHPAPRPAELLVVDGHASRLAIARTAPAGVPVT